MEHKYKKFKQLYKRNLIPAKPVAWSDPMWCPIGKRTLIVYAQAPDSLSCEGVV